MSLEATASGVAARAATESDDVFARVAAASDSTRLANRVARNFFALNLLAVAGVVIGSNIGTALFLQTFSARYLPHAFVLVALVSITAERVMRSLDQRINPMKLMRLTILFLVSSTGLVWIAIIFQIKLATVCLYILPELAAFSVFSQVWNLASRHFDFSESKRRFPFIAAGGSLGGAIGGAGVTLISGITAPVNALGVWILIMLFVPPLVSAIERGGTAVEKWKPAGDKPEQARGKFLRRVRLRFQSFFAQKFLLIVSIYVILGAVLTQLLDFQSQFVFSEVYSSPAELAKFLGLFTSLSFVVGLLLQTIVLSPLVRKIGAGNATFIFPLCTAMAGLFLARWPGLPAAVCGAFTRRYLKGSFFTVLVDILLNALHPEERSRMRSLLKGPVAAMTTIVASLVILAVQATGGLGSVATLTVAFGLVFVGTAFILRRQYVICLIEQIGKGRSGFAETASFSHGVMEVDMHPDHYISTLEKADDDIAMILFEEYRDTLSDEVIDRLPEFYPRASAKVREAIVRTVRSRMREKDKTWLEGLLRAGDEDSVVALYMEKGDFMEPLVSEHALETIESEKSTRSLRPSQARLSVDSRDTSSRQAGLVHGGRRLKRAALYHICLAPSQYYAYRGHLKLEDTITTGEKDDLLWAMEIVRHLDERKLLEEFVPFLKDGDVIDAWLGLMDRLEDGRDDIFAQPLLKIFRNDSSGRRRAALKILERIPAYETFADLWSAFPELMPAEQETILRMGGRWKLLGPESLASLLANASLQQSLFMLACGTWKHLESSRVKSVHQDRISVSLRNSLEQSRADHAELSAASSGSKQMDLTTIVLRERIALLVDKSLAWKAVTIMPLDGYESVYEGLISQEKGMADRAIETIENTGGVGDATVVKELRELLMALRTHPKDSSEPFGLAPSATAGKETSRDILLRLSRDRDAWLASVAVASLARNAKSYRVNRTEVEARMKPAHLRDPYMAEALSLMPAQTATAA